MIDEELLADVKRVRRQLIDELLEMQEPGGYWTGELSTSALSTATTCVAFEMLIRAGVTESAGRPLRPLIDGGLKWLAENVNEDGGWGDTVKSKSNISTTTLCRAALTACTASRRRQSPDNSDKASGNETENSQQHFASVIANADAWIAEATQRHPSLSAAIVARYGKDKTFSVPILMQCALAGVVDWKEIPRLPFELAVLPHRFYAAVKLPVVSYALPALIAIGQLLHKKNPTWFLPLRWFRSWAIDRTLKKLVSLQPGHGGFLEAAPLTGFVTMALAAAGRPDHVVAQRGASFLVDSVRDDGSWPIDTNLSTWVTTLVVNALGDSARDELPNPDATLHWLLDQQHTEVHPFTQAAPGGWAWTPLPGGVPDADDTAGAIRALMHLRPPVEGRGSRIENRENAFSNEREREGEAPAEPPMREDAPDSKQRSRDQKHPESRITTESHSEAANLREPGSAGASHSQTSLVDRVDQAAANGLRWLASLQNRDGGIPTFCRGWGTLPFDRSSNDITAHALLACSESLERFLNDSDELFAKELCKHGVDLSAPDGIKKVEAVMKSYQTRFDVLGFSHECVSELQINAAEFLAVNHQQDGSWLPLWFGNQELDVEENPVYGTARVAIAFYKDRFDLWKSMVFNSQLLLNRSRGDSRPKSRRRHEAIQYLTKQLNDDCGLGGEIGIPSTVEETGVAAEAIVAAADKVLKNTREVSSRTRSNMFSWIEPWMYEKPLRYLVEAIDRGDHHDAQPIGFYFAKLWYFEKLYPYAFALGALQAAVDAFDRKRDGEQGVSTP